MTAEARATPGKIRCDACPVLCYIAEGKSGACDRYANHAGELVRLDPLTIIDSIDPKKAKPGMRLFMVSTTGEDAAYFELDENLKPQKTKMPASLELTVDRIGENCEPALTTVLFMAGAGGSLRAGVTENPVRLTRSVKNAFTRVTCGGAPVYVWPGGGITLMVDVTTLPEHSFGYVPTPAIVAPIEFTLRLDDYRDLGGHMDAVKRIEDVAKTDRLKVARWHNKGPWPGNPMNGLAAQ